MGGRGATSKVASSKSKNSNKNLIKKIVSLENKKNSEDIGDFLEKNKLSLMQEYDVIVNNGITTRTPNRNIGVYKKNERIGTIQVSRVGNKYRTKDVK